MTCNRESAAEKYCNEDRRSIRTALRLDIAPEDAILRQASLGNYNLIVMGVGRPAGETLFFVLRQGGSGSS